MNSNVFTALFCLLATARPDDPPPYRLPGDTEPVSYDLRLKPAAAEDDRAFSGVARIVIRTRRYTGRVVLNSRELAVTSVSGVRDVRTGRTVPVGGYACDEREERLVIDLRQRLIPPRLYEFNVSFEGALRDDFTGFHKYYYDYNDRSRWIIMTQFKPTFARTAFPCYDEPSYKTPYKIAIERRNQHFSLSNMPLSRTEVDQQSGWALDYFETTKPIPTYLVAFMVSDFDKKSLTNDNIAMYTRKEYIENTMYMMGKAPNLLGSVENFTRIPYMLPKLDLVGVPLMDAYQMENWGLNSHKEFHLTLPSNSNPEDEMTSSMAMLHEFLHQWFGNMVTTPWWDRAWLNEGVCNYLNYFITGTIRPDWDLDQRFVENVFQHALSWDQYNDTLPLTFPVATQEEIANALDVNVFDKSAALFRMLLYTVGETNFRRSLNKFLNDFAYSNAGPKELWETFDYVLYDADYIIEHDVTVSNSMYLWTEQAGYPLVNVVSYENGSVVITQERFLLFDSQKTDVNKWFVGLTYTTEKSLDFDNVTPNVWLKPTEEWMTISLPADSGWIIFNLQSTGFYRVNYDEKNWKRLLIQFITKSERIHFLNRAQIIDDAHHLSRATVIPYSYYFSLLEYLLMEDHVTPWNTAIDGLSAIANGIRRYPTEHLKFNEYVKKFAGILYRKLSKNQISNESTKIGWKKLLTWSCQSENPQCEESALQQFEAWTSGYNVSFEREDATMCVGMKMGDLAAWSKMYAFYEKAQSTPHKQAVALRALACVRNVQILFGYLNRMRLENENVHNFKTVFENVAYTPNGVKALAEFLLLKLDAILALSDGRRLASFAYNVLASKVATDDEIVVMNKIRLSVKSDDLRDLFNEKYQKIMSNIMWMERDHKKIIQAIGI